MRHPRGLQGRVAHLLSYRGIYFSLLIASSIPFMPSHAAVEVRSPSERVRAAIEKHPCREQIEKTLKSWNVLGHWSEQFSFDTGEQKFRSPTDRIGKWVQLRFFPKKEIELLNFTDRNAVELKLSSTSCLAKGEVIFAKSESIFRDKKTFAGFSVFRDADLESLLSARKRGVLFSWSPHESYSVTALEHARNAARAMKIELIALVEPSADPQSVIDAARALGLKRDQVRYFDSFELGLRNIGAQYPSWISFADGKLDASVRRGFDSMKGYQDAFSSLSGLKEFSGQ